MTHADLAPDPGLKVAFSYTTDELREIYGAYYAQAYKTNQHRLNSRQRLLWWLLIAGSGIAMLTLMILDTNGAFGMPTWLMLGLAVVLMLGLSNLTDDRPARRKLANRAVEAFLKSYLAEEVRREVTVAILDEGICIDNTTERLLVRWRGVGHLHQDPRFLSIQRLDGAGTAVPLRAFSDTGHADRFLAEARRRQLVAGGGHDQRVFAYLADNDAACPGCGYSLRGVRELKCPECGRRIAWSDIPGAFETR